MPTLLFFLFLDLLWFAFFAAITNDVDNADTDADADVRKEQRESEQPNCQIITCQSQKEKKTSAKVSFFEGVS